MTARIMSACLIKCSKSFNSAGTDNGEHKSTIKSSIKVPQKKESLQQVRKGCRSYLEMGYYRYEQACLL